MTPDYSWKYKTLPASKKPVIRQKATRRTGKYLAAIAIVGVAIFAIWFAVLPLINYSMQSGHEFSKHVSTNPSNASVELPRYAMNQPIRNDKLEITVTTIREGSNVLGSKKFYFVTAVLRNLRSDAPIQVSDSDFTLVDANGNLYFTYNISNQDEQVLGPLQTRSYELEFEIPRDATGLTLQFYSPKSAGGDSSVPVLFTLQ
jgi:hypothetical protein